MKKIIFAAFVTLAFFLSAEAPAQESLHDGHKAQLVAHRGGRFEADENTIPAFASALEAGITGYELDVHRTADNKFVIIHDFDISRRVVGEGTVEEMTLAQIRALKTRDGNTVPTLQEVLDLFGKYDGIYVEFELKTTREDLYPEPVLTRFADEIYAAISAARPANSTYVFSSFDARILKYLNARHPEEPIMYITSQGCTGETRAILKEIGIKRMACYRTRTTREEMDKAHEEGILINLWPTKDAVEVNLAYALGADYICTDRPRLICSLIDEGVIPVKK